VAAQLFGTGYIFVAMIIKLFQNRVQFSNNGIELFTQLLVHLFLDNLVHGIENNIGLIGQKLLRRLGLLGEKMFHFSPKLFCELIKVTPRGRGICSILVVFHRSIPYIFSLGNV